MFWEELGEPEHGGFIRETEVKIYSLVLTQSLSALSDAAQLNLSQWNMTTSYCQDQLFVSTWRSEHDLNGLCNNECWITKLLESATERHAACCILIVWTGADTTSAPPRGTWRHQQDSLGRLEQDRAFSQIAMLHSHAICPPPPPLDAPHENKWTLTSVAAAKMHKVTIHCRKSLLLRLFDEHFLRGWIQVLCTCDWIPLKQDGEKGKWSILGETLISSDDFGPSGCIVDYIKESKRQRARNSLEGSWARCCISAPAAQRS